MRLLLSNYQRTETSGNARLQHTCEEGKNEYGRRQIMMFLEYIGTIWDKFGTAVVPAEF